MFLAPVIRYFFELLKFCACFNKNMQKPAKSLYRNFLIKNIIKILKKEIIKFKQDIESKFSFAKKQIFIGKKTLQKSAIGEFKFLHSKIDLLVNQKSKIKTKIPSKNPFTFT